MTGMRLIGVDTGGTFTDVVVVTGEGSIAVGKALSTPGGVALTGSGSADLAATAVLRGGIRTRRLGGGSPASPLRDRPAQARRFSHALELVADRICCRRCGATLGTAGEDYYAALLLEEVPVTASAPGGAIYPGAERFTIRHLYCPACAEQVDVQIAAREDPVLRAAEPLLPG